MIIPARLCDDGTYLMPEHGWTCFFCGDTFMTPGAARDHFGAELGCTTACRIKFGDEMGLVMALRQAEAELSRYRAEDSDKDREFHAMRADHAQALKREEEKGYAKGLADGRSTLTLSAGETVGEGLIVMPIEATDAMIDAAQPLVDIACESCRSSPHWVEFLSADDLAQIYAAQIAAMAPG